MSLKLNKSVNKKPTNRKRLEYVFRSKANGVWKRTEIVQKNVEVRYRNSIKNSL